MSQAIDAKESPRWKVLALLLALLAVVPLIFYVLVVVGLKAHAKEDCQMQLGRIGVLCPEYAMLHGGSFPTNWQALESTLPSTNWYSMFICPSTGHRPDAWHRASEWVDYRLSAGRSTNDAAETILAIEPLSNHNSGANVLFVDGSTAWWPASRVLAKDKP